MNLILILNDTVNLEDSKHHHKMVLNNPLSLHSILLATQVCLVIEL